MIRRSLLLVLGLLVGCPGGADGPTDELPWAWPPVKGQPFPDIELRDHTGQLVKLSDHKGKVIVVEPIGISCPACQAFAGAHEVGTFMGGSAQQGLGSFEELLSDYGGVRLDREDDLLYVHLLLYDMSITRAPTVEEAAAWAEHFGMDGGGNRLVLTGDARLINDASYRMIPGFYLIDREFVLRGDGTGHQPQDHPYDVVLAMVPELLDE